MAQSPPRQRVPPTPRPLTKAERLPLAAFPTRGVWTLPLYGQLTAPPAYDDTRVFFATEGDRLAAYDLRSGVRQWMITAQPLLHLTAGGGLLFFIEGSALTALHAADGSSAWQVPFADTLAVRPVWDNGWLIVATSSGSMLAFRAMDGQLIWRRDLGAQAHAAPALAGDRVYVPLSDGRIVALHIKTGAPVWERRVGGTPNDLLALDDRVYVGSQDNFLYCLMSKNGVVDWRWPTGGDVIGVPIVDEHNVYFVSLDNTLRALDRKSGVQQWMKPLPLRPSWGPVKAGPTIAVGGQNATVRLYNAQDGAVLGALAAGGEVAESLRAIVDPGNGLPMLLVLTRDIAKGASARLFTRDVEPALAAVTPLPNLIMMTPGTAAPAVRP